MSNTITIERETLERAIDALECALGDSRPYIVKSREASTALRAALAQQAEPVAQPYAWHYTNNGGASVWHMGPSSRLDADIAAAAAFPKVHKVTPVYAAPPAPAAVPPDGPSVNRYCRVGMCLETDKQHTSNCIAAEQPAEPVAEVHAAHLRSSDENGGHWCREVLLYSGNSPHDWLNGKNTRVKLYAAAPADAQQPGPMQQQLLGVEGTGRACPRAARGAGVRGQTSTGVGDCTRHTRRTGGYEMTDVSAAIINYFKLRNNMADDNETARYLASYLEQNVDDFIHRNMYDEAPYEFDVQELTKLITKFYANLC